MALRFADNPKYYTTNAQALLGIWSANFPGTSAFNSVQSGPSAEESAWQFSGSGRTLQKILDAQQTWILHFHLMLSGTADPGSSAVAWLYDGATLQGKLRFNGSRQLQVVQGNGTVLGTCPSVIAFGVWYHVIFKYVIDNTAGAFGVKINNTLEVSGAAVDTQNSANASADRFSIGTTDTGANPDQRMASIVVFDGAGARNNDYGGILKVRATLPTGAGTYSELTPSAGSNYQNVDEASPDGDTTYNAATVTGQRDSYTYPALGVTGSVVGVIVRTYWRREDAGAQEGKSLARVGGADYLGEAKALAGSYLYDSHIYEDNPATAAAWTVAAVDASEFGAQRTA